jgi:hypothetical protein
MTGTHVTVGSALGGLVAVLLARYGFRLDSSSAALVGSVASAAGVGLAHLVTGVGLIPALRRVVFGPPKPVSAAPLFPPAVPPQAPPLPPPSDGPQIEIPRG